MSKMVTIDTNSVSMDQFRTLQKRIMDVMNNPYFDEEEGVIEGVNGSLAIAVCRAYNRECQHVVACSNITKLDAQELINYHGGRE